MIQRIYCRNPIVISLKIKKKNTAKILPTIYHMILVPKTNTRVLVPTILAYQNQNGSPHIDLIQNHQNNFFLIGKEDDEWQLSF